MNISNTILNNTQEEKTNPVQDLQNKPVVYLKGLNGIRAIAALAVVASHTLMAFKQFGLPEMHGLEMASYGVTMFFTLSGFLITYLLLIEKTEYGDVNIRQFYIRRILRIWPLYYFYLLLAVIILFSFGEDVFRSKLVLYFVLLANVPYILEIQMPVIGHYWSLGVEEQFYIFWPWIVRKVSRLFVWLFCFIIGVLLLKFACWWYYHKSGNPIPLATVHITRFHCMAVGACGAILFFNKHKLFLRLSYSYLAQAVIALVLFLIAINKFNIIPLINDEVVSGVSLLLIINVAGNTKSIFKLNGKIFDYTGKISFGIYVYHPLIIFLAEKLLASSLSNFPPTTRIIIISAIVLSVTFLVAGLSYKYFESRIIRYKSKFARIKSSGSAEEALSLAKVN